MKNNYLLYKEELGSIPEFLNKYLDLDILVRLKDISLLCGMDYASKSAYNFKFYVSRYDHSLNVALITWNLSHDKAATLSALFHDVASPVFSHVVDYMNEDYINCESTEEFTFDILSSSDELKHYLSMDGLSVNDIYDFKSYSVVDLDRPKMCADRLESIISVGMAWVGSVSFEAAKLILNSSRLYVNEDNEYEIGFDDYNVGEYVKYINDIINKYTHTNEDMFMMMHTAKLLKKLINLSIITYEDLYKLTEHEIIDIIESNLELDKELDELWDIFLSISDIPSIEVPKIKNKIVNPLVNNVRI